MISMKVLYICNNYGSIEDGVGDYSKNMFESLSESCDIDLLTSYTTNYNKIRKILSLKMSNVLIKASKIIQKKHYDSIIIEYPFVEWNPLIFIAYSLLYRRTRKENTKMCISLHEYDRVSFFRKIIIRYMIKRSDLFFVNNKDRYKELLKYNSNMYIRDIPSNINTDKYNFDYSKKNQNSFAFFGLVNKSKAFEEMMDGWYDFYSQNSEKDNYELNIISSTPDLVFKERMGVVLHYNASSDEIFNILSNSSYMILPIIPSLTQNSGSLKTACGFGCIPSGIFSAELESKNIGVPMEKYSPNDFKKIYTRLINMNQKEKEELMKNSIEFASDYSFGNNTKIIMSVLQKEVGDNNAKN